MKEKETKTTKLTLTEKQINRFYDTLIKIFEDKYNVSIDYVLKKAN